MGKVQFIMSDDHNLASRSLKAASWMFSVQFFNQFAQIFLGVCLARLLKPEDYGVLGMLAIFWGISNVFINGGFAQALLQRKEITETDVSSVFYYNMFLSLLCCFSMLIAAPWIAKFYSQPILRQTIMVSAWVLPINAFLSVQRTLLLRRLKQGLLSVVHLASIPISGGIAVFLAWKGYGVWALVWQRFFAALCATLFLMPFVPCWPRAPFSMKALRDLFQFGSKVLAVNIIDDIFYNLNSVFIGKIYPAKTLGYYEQARRYSTLFPYGIQTTIKGILFPSFAKLQDDVPRLKRAFKRSLAASAFAVIFPAYILCTLSYPFIELVLSPKWIPCVPFWWLLTCSIILFPIHSLNIQALLARGHSGTVLKLEILKKSLAIIGLVVLAYYGLYEMLVWGIFSSCVCVCANSYCVKKDIGCGLGGQLKVVVVYAGLSAIACCCAWIFYKRFYSFAPWFGFVGGGIIGGLTYLILNWLFKTQALFDVLSIVSSKFIFLRRFIQGGKLE